MPIITIGSNKGGAGKSTLISNFTVMRRRTGVATVLIDGDPRASVSQWGMQREVRRVEPFIDVRFSHSWRTMDGFDKAMFDNRINKISGFCDTVFIDTPGNNDIGLIASISLSDLWVIPLRPSNFDIWGFSRDMGGDDMGMIELARVNNPKLKVLIVINGVASLQSVRKRELENVHDTLSHYAGFDVAENYITTCAVFNSAVAEGKAVVEMDSVSKSVVSAKKELIAVYNEIFSRLGE